MDDSWCYSLGFVGGIFMAYRYKIPKYVAFLSAAILIFLDMIFP